MAKRDYYEVLGVDRGASDGEIDHEQPLRHADLRRRQPDPRRRVHGLEHVVDQLLGRRVGRIAHRTRRRL